jgi:lipoate---protein ligase
VSPPPAPNSPDVGPDSGVDPDPAWTVHRRSGSAADLHGLDLLGTTTGDPTKDASPGLSRGIWLLDPSAPAVVLGSAQRFGPAASAGETHPLAGSDDTAVVVRRSGGGAVVLEPGATLWVDVVVPRHDPLWDDDVSTSSHWLGRAWVAALATVGIDAGMHTGPADQHPLARAACFAGLGPGEVTSHGRKLVGISQRRTRAGARFQCVAYTAPPPVDALLAALGDAVDADELALVLAGRTGWVPVDPGVLADALCHAIIAPGRSRSPSSPSLASPPAVSQAVECEQ